MLVVAVVAIIVVGPKDLPKMLRSFGKVMGNMRRMAGDFQKQFDDAVREADLEEVKKVASGKGFAPLDDIKKATEKYNRDLKQSIEDAGSNGDKTAVPKMASAGDDPGAIAEESLPEPAKPAKPAAAEKPVKSSPKPAAESSDSAAAKKQPARKPAAKKPAAKKAAPGKAAKAS